MPFRYLKNGQKNILINYIIALGVSLTLYFYLVFDFPTRPLGVDAIPHAAKISLLREWKLEGFKWLPVYYFGNPHFTLYPPASYIIPLIIVEVIKASIIDIIIVQNLMALISILLLAVGLTFLVYHITGKHHVAIISSLFLISNPALYEPWIWGGNYPELYSIPTIPWGILFLDRWLKNKGYSNLVLYVVLGAYALTSHQAVGMFFMLLSSIWILTHKDELLRRITKLFTINLLLVLSSFYYIAPLFYIEQFYKVREDVLQQFTQNFTIGDYISSFVHVSLGHGFLTFNYYPLPTLRIIPILVLFVYSVVRKKYGSNKARTLALYSLSFFLIIYFILSTLSITPFPAGFLPYRYTPYIAIFSSLGIAYSLTSISERRKTITILVCILLLLMSYYAVLPIYSITNKEIQEYPLDAEEVQILESVDANAYVNSHRIGILSSGFGSVINLYFPNYYTSKGYYAQGILFIDWQHWFENTIFSSEAKTLNSRNSVLHLLDWSGTGYLVLSGNEKTFSFIKREFNEVGEVANYLILEASSTKVTESLVDGAVLFIGDEYGYDSFLRVLALSNYTGFAPVVVWGGGRCLDDVSAGDLQGFSAVVLYRFCYRDRVRAFDLLSEYVRDGGRVFFEAMPSRDEVASFPYPFPVKKTMRYGVRSAWNFTVLNIVVRLSEDGFSPPVYEGGPWGVSASSIDLLREGAEPIVVSGDKVLIALLRYGGGEFIWSGMNLPYHALSYRNVAEATMLRKLILGDIETTAKPVEMIRHSATRIEFRIPAGSKGLVFRERYIDNLVLSWRAWTEEGIGTKVMIMGPGFIYVKLEDEPRRDITLYLELRDGPLRIVSQAISIITLLFLLSYPLVRKLLTRRRRYPYFLD